jgi:hypothetical protein
MARTPEKLKKELFELLEKLADATTAVTSAVNIFPDHYEKILALLSVIRDANKLTCEVQEVVAESVDEGLTENDEDLQQRVDHFLRTQDWVKKNSELAAEAIAKLSQLEDVTLQFYDNPHPDVVFN